MAKCICQDPFVACNRNLFEASPVPNLLDHVTEAGRGSFDIRDSHDDGILSHYVVLILP